MLALSTMTYALAPCVSKATAFPFSLRFYSPIPIHFLSRSIGAMNSYTLHNPSAFSISFLEPLKNPSRSRQIHCSKTQSSSFSSSSSHGEIHVIIGPMFAGKTTTLLKRVKSESSNGSFQATGSRNIDHINKTLKHLCLSGGVTKAVGILCSMSVQVDSETYSLLLQDCIFRKDYRKGKRIHWQMVVVGFIPNEYLSVKLLILYAKAGDLHTADILFDKLQTKSLVSWNAMIAGYVQKNLEEVALIFYRKMRKDGITPDQYTFASVFRACASLAMLEQGKQAHALSIKTHIRRNLIVDSALMDMYFKCSSLSDACLVFDKSLERNVVSWSALVCGYGLHGRVLEVLSSFHRMIEEGFTPNHVTFLAVLSACNHGGLVNEGLEYFFSMQRDYGVKPRERHYAAVVDLLGRTGRLHDAYQFLNSSPCKEHPVVWGALLGACRMHGNIDIAKLAAKNYLKMEAVNIGKYVVLSNVFASFGLWDSVARIRNLMKETGMRKEPGFSMIEIQREVHFFFMEHNTHEQTELIHEWIKDLTFVLKNIEPYSDLIT